MIEGQGTKYFLKVCVGGQDKKKDKKIPPMALTWPITMSIPFLTFFLT